ncbi:helix-turn-helix domain-containing protein, partial [bacterium]|nr:helix-turn-helix domain-containing protein [bacterium]
MAKIIIITAKQTAELLDVSLATVRNWVRHGYLIPVENTKNKFLENEVILLKQKIESGDIQRLRTRANKKLSNISF